jgi:hypothetical protein
MSTCKTPNKIIRDANHAGFDNTELAMVKALIGDRIDKRINAKGKINWHITDEDWEPVDIRDDIGLGLHVGTRDVVKDYHKQMFSKRNKKVYLHRIENLEQLNMVELTEKFLVTRNRIPFSSISTAETSSNMPSSLIPW